MHWHLDPAALAARMQGRIKTFQASSDFSVAQPLDSSLHDALGTVDLVALAAQNRGWPVEAPEGGNDPIITYPERSSCCRASARRNSYIQCLALHGHAFNSS